MVRSDLIAALQAKYPSLSAQEVNASVSVFFDTIADGLAAGRRVELRGFGAFVLRDRIARTGRNPRAGDQLNVSAKRVARYRQSKLLHRRLNP